MHAFLDNYTVFVASLLLGKSKWFSRNIDSPTLKEHIANVCVTVPPIKGEGIYECDGTSLVGDLDPAFHVAQWLGSEYPTIVYHHGNNETPFNYGVASKNTFKLIFLAQKKMFKANLISIRAPFHNQGLKSYVSKVADLSNFAALLAGSVKVEEKLVQQLKAMGCPRVVLVGTSLGGWVTNLHRAYFNSADVYIPIFAGAALDEVFLTSSYSKLAAKEAAINSNAIKDVLNFENDFTKITDPNIHPVLARYDQIIQFDRQKPCYGKLDVRVLAKGHVTGALAAKELREHVLSCL